MKNFLWQSFENKGFWMEKSSTCLTDGEINHDGSRIEPKRSYQWFVDGTEADQFPHKKQAVEAPNSYLFSGISNISSWNNDLSFHSVLDPFNERLFYSEAARSINIDERSIPSVGVENISMGRKVLEDPFSNDSSFGLSISNAQEDIGFSLNYGGLRKVKVSQVKESENVMPISMGHTYDQADNNAMPTAETYNKFDENSITVGIGVTYNRGDNNIIAMGDTFGGEDNNFMSIGQAYSKSVDNSMAASQSFGKDDVRIMSMGQTFNQEDESTTLMAHSLNKGDCNIMSMMGQGFHGGDDSSTSLDHSFNKVDNSNLSTGHLYTKAGSNIISFGGSYEDHDSDASGRLIGSYDLLMGQPSIHASEVLNQKLVESCAGGFVSSTQTTGSGSETVSKKDQQKTTKKIPPNNFPSNVRSLLSTGMLDGVPVKYIAWSQEKELHGIIKGSGYQCGCQSCNFSKVINAYEFERHAGCKTKHPNNHIYLENGKTIYSIVQELRSTPKNVLFEVIQTITGSPINQKSFRLWKGDTNYSMKLTLMNQDIFFVPSFSNNALFHFSESFLAATCELQRIYGNDERKQIF
ncbi:Tify domain binding domain [Dillenia turbinata]|uniref:Tify domain binding domain n=1 Tax=Dillenia turbinata TaxID=194707 RepID=A0AAN8W882_9MAGN